MDKSDHLTFCSFLSENFPLVNDHPDVAGLLGDPYILQNLGAAMASSFHDEGTAWELGYAAALQKPAIGIFTDWRKRFEGEEVVNLMISRSLDTIVKSLDELVSVLREYREQSK